MNCAILKLLDKKVSSFQPFFLMCKLHADSKNQKAGTRNSYIKHTSINYT